MHDIVVAKSVKVTTSIVRCPIVEVFFCFERKMAELKSVSFLFFFLA